MSTTRYTYLPATTPSERRPAVVEETEDETSLEVNDGLFVITGNSTPTGLPDTGSWVSVSPNAQVSEPDLDGENDGIDSPVEEIEASQRRANNSARPLMEAEDEEALRASLSELLASAARPKFRQQARDLNNESAARSFRNLVSLSPPLIATMNEALPTQMGSSDTRHTRQEAGVSSERLRFVSDIHQELSVAFSPSVTESQTFERYDRRTFTPPFDAGSRTKIDMSLDAVQEPRMAYSAPSSPFVADYSVTEEANHDEIPSSSGASSCDERYTPADEDPQAPFPRRFERRRPSRRTGQGSTTNRGVNSSDNGSVSPLVLGGTGTTSSMSSSSEHQRITKKGGERRRGGANDSSDDGNRWYNKDITFSIWAAAIISGVLLSAGFGAGSLWRGSRGGHYSTSSA